MRNYVTNIAKFFLLFYPRYICKREFEQPNEYTFNERPIEFRFVFQQLSKIYPKKILDVGTGTTALPHVMRNCGFNVTATDNIKDYWPSGMFNRHYHVVNDDITDTKLEQKFDLITCISVLEHILDFDTAIKNMFSLLNPNGYLVISFPYTEKQYIPNVYTEPESTSGQGAPYVAQSFSRKNLTKWISDNDTKIIEQEYWRVFEGDFWTAGKKTALPDKVGVDDLHQLSCVLMQKIN
jgi:2-polyprenyl-3-methyl-5-hydroxy-6-metoxy-1,4-benzoquinol methylase